MSNILIKKKLVIFLFIVAYFVFASLSVTATMQYGVIEEYKVEMDINSNKEIGVSERIVHRVNAGENREIVRIIPRLVEEDGQSTTIKISNLILRDSFGNKVDYKMKKQRDKYAISFVNKSDEVESYELEYKIDNAFLSDNATQALLINWLGLFEANNIKQTKLILKMPGNVSQNEIESQCLSGGENRGDCVSSRYEYGSQNMVSGIVFVDDSLPVGHSIEYSVILPRYIFQENSLVVTIMSIVRAKWIYIVGLLILFFIVYKFIKRKK